MMSGYLGGLLGLIAGVFVSVALALGAEILGEMFHYHDAGHGGAFPVLACATFLLLCPILAILGGRLGFILATPRQNSDEP